MWEIASEINESGEALAEDNETAASFSELVGEAVQHTENELSAPSGRASFVTARVAR
jgi:hypothetical protein